MRLIQSFILFVALLPGLAMALGLGKLQSHSALNEPFSARIDLLSPTVEELDSLNVRLADVEAFRRAGIPRTRVLTELHFSLKRPEAGTDYIHIYSDDPVREPFLNFLIEVSWSKGRLYREYTVLLDPPVYIGARTGKKPVQTTAPVSGPVAPSGGEVQAIEDNKVVYNPEYKPSARTTTAPAPVPARAVDYSGGDYGPVVSGDTLWSIASAMRPDSSVSVQQTMLALLRANPDAFINNNINGLKRGHVLKMPDRTAIQSVSKNDAFAEAKLQNNLWEEARGALATAVTPRPEGAPVAEQPAAPTAETEAAPSPAMGEEPELRLVAPSEEGEAGEQAGTASNEALTQELALANESLEALKLENNELRDKLSETEAIIDDLNRLIVLKESELAELQQQVATAEMQAKAEAEEKAAAEKEKAAAAATKQKMAEKPAEETAAAGSGKKEKMAEKPAEAVPPPPPEEGGITSLIPPSLSGVIDIIRNNLLYVAAAVIALLLLIVGSIYVKRRRAEPATEIPQSAFPDFGEMETEAGAESEDITDMNPELEEAGSEETLLPESGEETISPEFGEETDATQIITPPAGADTGQAAASTEETAEEEDPLAEVNVFLAYEHFDQAEEFVKNALEKDPDNLEFHTKLLEVYYAANDKKGYEEAARILHDKVGGEGDYWNMAVAMWQEMSPNRELFAEPVAGEEEEVAAGEAEGGGMLNIAGEEEGGEAKGLDLDFAATEEAEDLEVSDSGEANEEDADILDVTAAIDLDNEDEVLDVTASADENEGLSLSEEAGGDTDADEDVLDISSAGDEESLDLSFDQSETEEEKEEAVDDNSLDFSLDMEEETAERSVEEAGDMSFEVDDTGEDEATDEDNSLDLSLEMDSDEQGKGETEDSLDLSFDVSDEGAGEAAADEDSSLDKSTEGEDEGEKTGTGDALDFSLDLSETGGGEEEPEQADDSDLDMSGSGAEPAEEESEFSFDLEESAPQDTDVEEKQDEDLLDVTSVSEVDDKSEPVDDILDVSKNTTDGDLLDVTKTTDFDVDKDEDLLDVTTSATGAGIDADELLGRDKADEQEQVEEKQDVGEVDFHIDEESGDSEGSGLDFELSPDESEDGAESTNMLDFSIDGGEELEEGDDSSPGIDMESTMQMPKRSQMDTDLESEDEDSSDQTIMVPRSGDSPEQSEEDEIASQLDLAKAYVELGDTDNAKTILNEVIEIGNDSQRQQAEELLGQLQ